ncbi:hypothetical protein [Paenibacillus aestuarii]|uniref:Uncharacterized protein n=1 Tax=Paenibacillus aestuarii TaxID=516965 RepID=A0ABW0K284_9BACL|nr:hypothetical protein [Paenibacillus aestuarii]
MQWKNLLKVVGISLSLLQLSTSAAAATNLFSSTSTPEPFLSTSPASYPQGKQVYVVSIPGLSFLELERSLLTRLPNLQRLTEQGAVGAMNIRTSTRSMRDVYATIGAGVSAVGGKDVQGYASYEWLDHSQAVDRRNRLLGGLTQGAPELIVPDMAMLERANQSMHIDSMPGALGEAFKKHGVQRVVWGSSDLGLLMAKGTPLRRYSPLMLMDAEGTVDKGDLGRAAHVQAVDRPYGVRTNYAQLQAWLDQANDRATAEGRITLIELGDLYRLYTEKKYYREARFLELHEQILQEQDQWLGALMARMKAEDSLWVFSPEVNSKAASAKAWLSPVISYKSGGGRSVGLLTSESTRRSGVVTAQDFTAALLAEFNIQLPEGMAGQVATAEIRQSGAWPTLLEEMKRMQTIYRLRPELLYPFVTFEMIVLLGGLLTLFIIKKGTWLNRYVGSTGRSGRGLLGQRIVRSALYSLLTAPLLMLLLGLLVAPITQQLNIQSAIAVLEAIFVIGTALLSLALHRLPLAAVMAWLGTGTALMITLDGSTGAHAMKYSPLSYDPMIGARYYGIGNEYMGVMIGALILGVTAALQRRHDREPALHGGGQGESAPRTLAELETAAAAEAPPAAAKPARTVWMAACAAFLLVTVCLAAPSLGANAGGALSAAVAFGVAGVLITAGSRWRERRLSRGIALLAALLALGFVALWLLNSADSPVAAARESHVGRAFHALRDGRFDQIGHLIERKLRMNVHLLRASAWSKVLITSLLVMAVLVLRPRGRLQLWQHKYPYWMYGFSANMCGAIAALLLNDSGIVAAATLIIFVAVPMLLLRLEEEA